MADPGPPTPRNVAGGIGCILVKRLGLLVTLYEHALSQWIFDFDDAKLADSDASLWVGWGFEDLVG